MHLIKVNAISSTNSFAREMFKENPQMPLTCIVAKKQLDGRGQRGTKWDAEDGKNLTFSVLLPRPEIEPGNQFLLSAAVANGLVSCLEKLNLSRLKIKWPNDIMAANYKIAGILIENIISEGKVAGSIIGIGLNVNQEHFPGLPQASSLKRITGNDFDHDSLLESLLQDLEIELKKIPTEASLLFKRYKKDLFRLGKVSTFKFPDGRLFTGIIRDVDLSGKLIVHSDTEIRSFDLKQVQLCF